jgi:hypothetical protein
MAKDLLRYDRMVEAALRGVVREALAKAAERGLPGNHHFYITLRTSHPGVEIPGYLASRYPTEMTIILQYQFWGLRVEEDAFSVILSFNDVRENLRIPFAAITGFADPAVNFGLQFQEAVAAPAVPETPRSPAAEAPTSGDEAADAASDNIVALETFRKK